MVRSLWSAASGMNAQQANIDTISNNLSNVNTVGYKKQRAEFEDLLYQSVRLAGTPASEDTVSPLPIQMGHGVKVAATQRMYDQGALQATDVPSDMAINGDGFFRVQLQDGSYAYTRNGAFEIDSNGQLVSAQGYKMMPETILPQGFIPSTLVIADDGRVSVKIPGQDDPVQVGQLELYRFPNPAGMTALGENLLKVSNASGEAIPGRPGTPGFGTTKQKYLEMSNVSIVKEMVGMIVAQRAYEFNSKAIQTSDSMLGTATQLKR